ncbi:MAG: 30S ribosomal protein S20 [Myxococcota bacterium]
MANHKSAEKRNRQRITRTLRARSLRTRVRTSIKKARAAVDGGDTTAATPLVRDACALLDRAASKNVLPKKRASRLKSRLTLALNKIATA